MIQKIKALLHPVLSRLLVLEFRLHRFLLRALKSRGAQNPAVLREYLSMEREIHCELIDLLGIDASGGSHPKHRFDYRSEFFLSAVASGQSVLDVACGSTGLAKKLVGRGCSVVGIDLQVRSEDLGQLRLIQADILTFNYPELQKRQPYEIAIFSHILEHLDRPVDLLRAVAAPQILICVPSRENWLKQLKLSLGLSDLTDTTHRKEYSRSQLREELAEAGYRVDEIGFNGEGEIIARAQRV